MQDIFLVELVSKMNENACYLRNNKADGEKNVRCFPECRAGGHCDSGFCGSSIKAILTRTFPNDRIDRKLAESLVIVGEFMPSDYRSTILQESIVTERLLNQTATFSKYYKANISFPTSEMSSFVELEFNANAKSWGYSYVAHRCKTRSRHQFVISILSAINSSIGEEKTYNWLGVYRSSEFEIKCQRRAQCERRGDYRSIRPVNSLRTPSVIESKNVLLRPVMKIEEIPQCFVVDSYQPKTENSDEASTSSSKCQDFVPSHNVTGVSPHEKSGDMIYDETSNFTYPPEQCKPSSISCRIKSEDDTQNFIVGEITQIKMKMKTEMATITETETEINCSFSMVDRSHSSRRIALLQQLFPYDITDYCASDSSHS